MKNIKYIILSSVIVLATGLVSCLDSEFDVDESYNRLFSPVSFETTNETSTTVDFTWKNIPAASYYLIELSLTEDFAEVYKTYGENQEITTNAYTATGLTPNTDYWARIKCMSTQGIPESKYPQVITFTTKKLVNVEFSTTVDATWIRLSWIVPEGSVNNVTKIVLKDAAGAIVKSVEDAAELADNTLLFENLTALTTYHWEAYDGATLFDEDDVTTLPDVLPGTDIIEIDNTTTENINTLIAATTQGNILIKIAAGTTLNVVTEDGSDTGFIIPVGKSVTIKGIVTEANRTNLPIIKMKEFNFTQMPSLTLENVHIIGSGTQASYVIKGEADQTQLDKIEIDNCIIENMRGIFSLRSTSPLAPEVTVNNTTIRDLKDYGVFQSEASAGGGYKSIVVTNSTFDGIQYLLRAKNAPTAYNVISFSDCTFNKTVLDGKYLVDLANATQSLTTFEFVNCIFGSAYSGTPKVTKAPTKPTFTNCYKTTDFAPSSMDGVIDYEKSAADLFTDPSSGNFLIKDASFIGKDSAGDPIWRP